MIEYFDHTPPPTTPFSEPGFLPRRTAYGEATEHGLVPVSDYVDMAIPKADWPDAIAACEASQSFPVHHQLANGWATGWSQDGLNYCWAFSLTAATMDRRIIEGKPHVMLGPTSLGWLVRWRNDGYYLDEAIRGARERGIAPASFTAGYSISPSRFKQWWEEEAVNYRPLEWWDIPGGRGDTTIGHCLAVLRTGCPLYVAYNWWGHAVECVGMRWDANRRQVGWVIRNSHGEKEPIVLWGNRGIPDEAYGVRSCSLAEDDFSQRGAA